MAAKRARVPCGASFWTARLFDDAASARGRDRHDARRAQSISGTLTTRRRRVGGSRGPPIKASPLRLRQALAAHGRGHRRGPLRCPISSSLRHRPSHRCGPGPRHWLPRSLESSFATWQGCKGAQAFFSGSSEKSVLGIVVSRVSDNRSPQVRSAQRRRLFPALATRTAAAAASADGTPDFACLRCDNMRWALLWLTLQL